MDGLSALLAAEDMKRLQKYCNKSDRRFHAGDSSLYEDWKGSFVGDAEYLKIFTGFSGEEGPEIIGSGYSSDNFYPRMHDGPDNSGQEFYLAFHQWNAFEKWLTKHPECAASVRAFKVCQCYCILY